MRVAINNKHTPMEKNGRKIFLSTSLFVLAALREDMSLRERKREQHRSWCASSLRAQCPWRFFFYYNYPQEIHMYDKYIQNIHTYTHVYALMDTIHAHFLAQTLHKLHSCTNLHSFLSPSSYTSVHICTVPQVSLVVNHIDYNTFQHRRA